MPPLVTGNIIKWEAGLPHGHRPRSGRSQPVDGRALSRSQFALVASGIHRATLTRAYPFANSYGERIAFEFVLQGPGVEGLPVLCSTSPSLSPKGKLAAILAGILGEGLLEAVQPPRIDFSAFAGSECLVLVKQAQNKAGTLYSEVVATMQITSEPKGRESQEVSENERQCRECCGSKYTG